MAQRSSLRASDEDRERVAEWLRRAAAEGRLLAHELEDRLATALRAQTYGELDSVVADLPGERLPRGPKSRSRTRELAIKHPVAAIVLAATVGVIAVAVVTAIIVALLFMYGFWLILAALFFGHRRRRQSYPYWLAYTQRYMRRYGLDGRYGRRHGRLSGPRRAGSWF